MINDNDLLLLASSQNNKTFEVYIDSSGKKTLTPQTSNYTAKLKEPYVCNHSNKSGLLYDKNPKKVIFPNCSEVKGDNDSGAFEKAFMNCTSLTSVSFPSLTTATGGSGGVYTNIGAFDGAFMNCTSLTSVSFPSLTTATGGSDNDTNIGAFIGAFMNCTSLTSVSFPSLRTATGGSGGEYNYGAFFSAFNNCTSLTSVSFPSLTTVTAKSGRDATFDYAFDNCSPSLKVHFKKSMKGTKGLDYKTMGLTSADQVVFDLP